MKQLSFLKLTICTTFLSAVFILCPLLGACYAILSFCTFALYGIDKQRAVQKKRRIPERLLLLLSLAGGWIGAYSGSKVFRHKTAKKRFILMFRLAAACHAGANIILIHYFYPLDLTIRIGQNT
ncbi:TPA: DUF1294 domain-containing protein [Neisseria lactamica]